MIFPCLICTSETYKKADKQGRIFHFCPACHFISLDEKFIISFEEERQRYELHNNDYGNEGYMKWLKSFTEEAVIPYINRESRILDFGSGPNPLLKEILEEEGYKVEIYDKHFYDHPFSGPYDAIVSTEVLEHLQYPLLEITNLKAHLKKDGLLVIKTSFRPQSDESFLKWWYKEDITHISFFSPVTMDVLSEIADLSVHFCDYKSIIILKKLTL